MIGLVLAIALTVALVATEWMGNAMIAFPVAAGLASAGAMGAWSADLAGASQLAVALLSGLASGWLAHKATQRTDVHAAARAARRERADETRPSISRR